MFGSSVDESRQEMGGHGGVRSRERDPGLVLYRKEGTVGVF